MKGLVKGKRAVMAAVAVVVVVIMAVVVAVFHQTGSSECNSQVDNSKSSGESILVVENSSSVASSNNGFLEFLEAKLLLLTQINLCKIKSPHIDPAEFSYHVGNTSGHLVHLIKLLNSTRFALNVTSNEYNETIGSIALQPAVTVNKLSLNFYCRLWYQSSTSIDKIYPFCLCEGYPVHWIIYTVVFIGFPAVLFKLGAFNL